MAMMCTALCTTRSSAVVCNSPPPVIINFQSAIAKTYYKDFEESITEEE
jgi:hypothetical protein